MKRTQYEKHGLSYTPEYIAWACMLDRCANPRNKRFKDYGGRGISVCERWRQSFLAFLEDVGQRPDSKMSLDRIDNSGNYEPGNVRWALPVTQAANRRTNHPLTIGGITMSVTEWARLRGVRRGTVYSRIRAGWPEEHLFSKSFQFKGNQDKYHERRVAQITHCPQGHEYNEQNTYITKTGARHCRACAKTRARAYEKVRIRDPRFAA